MMYVHNERNVPRGEEPSVPVEDLILNERNRISSNRQQNALLLSSSLKRNTRTA